MPDFLLLAKTYRIEMPITAVGDCGLEADFLIPNQNIYSDIQQLWVVARGGVTPSRTQFLRASMLQVRPGCIKVP